MPEWLRYWIRHQLLPVLGFKPYELAFGLLRGMFDAILFFLLVIGLLTGSRFYMDGRYALPRTTQEIVVKWAPVADYIARRTDIPREVPLVLWFKENSMQAVNPEVCTGIIGAYDLVRSGAHPCFTPGPISELEVAEQLTIGAVEFKKRCPEITYWTQDPALMKRCYFAYNAGTGAASRLDADESAYVMNNYDEAHQNMVYSDVELGTVQVTSLGAWPAHLAIQSLIVSQLDGTQEPETLTASGMARRFYQSAFVDAGTRLYDWAINGLAALSGASLPGSRHLDLPDGRAANEMECLGKPHIIGRPSLRPKLNPVAEIPQLTQDLHGCSYSLPGMDITSENRSAVLQAPMPGHLTTFTDRWRNSTIRIENDEWIVWLLHPRTYLVAEGEVKRGQAIGIMGAVGYATGPHVHYTIYDKVNESFVDPGIFLP